MDRLPIEVLEKVFEFLPYEDRKAVVLVNSRWRKAGEAPHLWTSTGLYWVADRKRRKKAMKMLSFKRLARVDEIGINAEAVSNNLLEAMIQHTGLKKIELWGGYNTGGKLPAGLDSQLMTEALAKVEDLSVYSSLPPHHLYDLLTEVSQGRSTLNRLSLNTNLGEVPAALVASALTRLVEVYLASRLTTDQAAVLMEAIDQDDSSLKKLTLHSSLPTEDERTGPINLKPLVKLEVVMLFGNFHTRQELVDFFAAIFPSTKLRTLSFCSRLPWPAEEEMDGNTKVVARAINFLEWVNMNFHPYQVCNLRSST